MGMFAIGGSRRHSGACEARTRNLEIPGLVLRTILVFQERAERIADHLRGQGAGVEFGQRGGPVDGLGDAGRFVEVLVAQRLHEAHHLLRQFLGDIGDARFDDRQFALGRGIVDPVIEAAALQRVVNFAGAVRGDDHDRRCRRLHGAEFGDRDLKVREDFQKISLERLIGAVEFVDQEHRRARHIRLQRLQQRPLDQKAVGEDIAGELVAIGIAGGFREPDRDHLRRTVPLIDRGGDVETFIALQPDQLAAKRGRQHFCNFGLADAGLAFEEQRPAHAQRQIRHRRQRALREIAARRQEFEHRIDGTG